MLKIQLRTVPGWEIMRFNGAAAATLKSGPEGSLVYLAGAVVGRGDIAGSGAFCQEKQGQ